MIAAIYDIHGNLPALVSTLENLKYNGLTHLIIGGDVILGPMSRECLELLLELSIPTAFIKGNCEEMVLRQSKNLSLPPLPDSVIETIKWTAKQLTADQLEIIESWPDTTTLMIENVGNALFCHATPLSNSFNFTIETPEDQLARHFENTLADLIICGHTHMQFDRIIQGIRVVNAGSVGMPFGEPGSYYLSFESGLHFKHLNYNLNEACKQIKATEYPGAASFAENHVLYPPEEATMIKVLSGSKP